MSNKYPRIVRDRGFDRVVFSEDEEGEVRRNGWEAAGFVNVQVDASESETDPGAFARTRITKTVVLRPAHPR